VIPLLDGSDFDVAGMVTTIVEISATVGFFVVITDAVGDCNAELQRLTEALLLQRLELPAMAAASAGGRAAEAVAVASEVIDRMIVVLAHTREHRPLEFCGLHNLQHFMRLLFGMLGGCVSLAAAWLIATSTAPVIHVGINGSTNVAR